MKFSKEQTNCEENFFKFPVVENNGAIGEREGGNPCYPYKPINKYSFRRVGASSWDNERADRYLPVAGKLKSIPVIRKLQCRLPAYYKTDAINMKDKIA